MKVLTPKFRVSFPNVFKAKVNNLSGEEEFSLVALFPKDADLTFLKAAAKEAIVEKWGADKSKWPKLLRNPLRDQADKMKEGVLPAGHEEGAMFLNLKTKQRPGIVNENMEDIIDSSEFYPGCYARASVNAYAYDQKGNRGVAFGLSNIQKMGDGESLGGRSTPEQDFAPVATDSSEHSADEMFN